MVIAMRMVGNKEGNGKGGKGDDNGNKKLSGTWQK
jgi:hypothetical protein